MEWPAEGATAAAQGRREEGRGGESCVAVEWPESSGGGGGQSGGGELTLGWGNTSAAQEGGGAGDGGGAEGGVALQWAARRDPHFAYKTVNDTDSLHIKQ